MNRISLVYSLGLLAFVCAAPGVEPIVFEDVTAKSGLASHLEKKAGHKPWRYGHGAGWGDVNGDGRPDLYVGAFAARDYFNGPDAPIPNMLFLNGPEGFTIDDNPPLQMLDRNARCAGVTFVDLDNDDDLDLVVANHVSSKNHLGSRLFENEGDGKFRDVTPKEGPWPNQMGTRNISAIDFNGDGLLDLVVADGTYGRQAKTEARLIVLKNEGTFRFTNYSARLGLDEAGTLGLGLAIGDVNQDGGPDIFVAGSNRLFVSDGQGQFQEAHRGRFSVPAADVEEGVHCGAAFADLNGDDLLDLVTTEHGAPTQIHMFQNRGVRDGLPDLIEVSETTGAGAVFPKGTRERPIKTNHVALRDMDNDGKPDILLAMIYQDDKQGVQPVVLRNLSKRDGGLRFERPPYDRLIGVYTPAPVADYDRDGRLDVFLPSWGETLPNYLFRNVTRGGNWLTVRVRGGKELNALGLGAIVRLYEPGHLGDPSRQLGRHDIAIGTGYASTEEALAHFGLGAAQRCDVQVSWSGKQVQRLDAAANQLLEIEVK